MAKRMTIEEKLAAIAALEKEHPSSDATRTLCGWLGEANNVAVARAAEAIGKRGQVDGIPALIAAFHRLISHPQPITVDKTCRAKEAIILALDALDNLDEEPYLLGMRHVQMEPVFGGRADTADALRSHCATALARKRYVEAHFALAPLLFDPEPQPRQAAIKALQFLGGEKSELLLRMKVLAGDAVPEMLGECFAALLALEPDRSLPFVADALHSSDSLAIEQAALALGNSRREEAFPILRACWEENSDLGLRKSLLLSMSLTRSEEAFEYLLSLMREEGGTTAILACQALALYGVDRRYRERIEAVVASVRNARLSDAYTELFPPMP